MSRTVDIPGGQATLRETKDLRVKHRRLLEVAAMAAAPVYGRLPADLPTDPDELAKVNILELGVDLTPGEITRLMELQDATIVALLESWTLADPLPTMDTLGDMDPEVYDALAEATKADGARIAQENDISVSPDPKVATSSSSSSDGPLNDDQEQMSQAT